MVNLISSENKDIAIFMLGHSMGGLITALYGIAYPNRLRGQIFSGAALDILPSSKGIKQYVIKIGAIILPKVKIKNPINEEICSVKQVFTNYINDPLVLKEASFKFYYEFLKVGIDKFQNNIKYYNYPCFITHGELDNISPNKISMDFYNAIQSEDKNYKIYKGIYHEILNEIEKDQVIKDMIQWLDIRV
jgi:alpha-beta hydrolase superfamily lysophospholipase